MKTRHVFLTLAAVLAVLISAFNNPNKAQRTTFASWSISLDLESALLSMDETRFKKRQTLIYDQLRLYNPKATEKTAYDIAVAIEEFNLDATDIMMRYSLYQLLYESGGKHFKNGKIHTSSAGALGIGQIKPTTAFHYLKQVMSDEDMTRLIELGATKIVFKEKDKVSRRVDKDGKVIWVTPESTKKKVAKWLENETNSILLWGYIMQTNTEKYGFTNALVIYNTGKNKWLRLKESGIDMNNHSYLRGIRKVEKFIERQEKAS